MPLIVPVMADVEKRVPRLAVGDEEDGREVEDVTDAKDNEKKSTLGKGKKSAKSRSDDFRLQQLDFESGNTIYRRKWWQLWSEFLHI